MNQPKITPITKQRRRKFHAWHAAHQFSFLIPDRSTAACDSASQRLSRRLSQQAHPLET